MFEEVASQSLVGDVVWLPMMNGDDAQAARAESAHLPEDRISQYWDPEKRLGGLFARTLGLEGVAWDVYLLYAPGVSWEADAPPKPTFWMHQLPEVVGAAENLRLDPGRFSKALIGQLPSSSAAVAPDLALRLHAKGLATVARDR